MNNFFLMGESIFLFFGVVFFIFFSSFLYALGRFRGERYQRKINKEFDDFSQDRAEIEDILESLSDGLFVVDKDNKIIYYNPAALSALDMIFPREKIIGKNVEDLLPVIGSHGPESITKKVFKDGRQSIRNDFRLVKPEKTIRLHTNISPFFDKEKKLKGATIFFRDITTEKLLDEQRAEFNAVASHELRTPLSIIEGYLFYVLDPASKLKYSKETREYLLRAHEAAENLNQLVGDILTIVRSEEGQLEIKPKNVDVVLEAQKIVKNFKDKAKECDLDLKFKVLTKERSIKVETDPIKFKEILDNLISNAIKFTKRGAVTIEIGRLQSEVMINVIDTGIGLAECEHENIFDKFYRVENYITRKSSGTGLGLYIVKTFVERLGGRVGVHSTPGKGSRFYFTLPLNYSKRATLDNDGDIK